MKRASKNFTHKRMINSEQHVLPLKIEFKHMKTLALSIALVLISTLGFSQETKGQTITVTIDNVLNDNGKVIFSLHNKDTFMKSDALQKEESKIKDGKVSVTFKNVEPGEYAIMAVHDENENNKMDFQANGMPKESYGMSNNPMSYGPPQYNDAKFLLENKNLEIGIRF